MSSIVFFDDVLAPGVRALPPKAFSAVEPFSLKEIVPFNPDYLAGWSVLIYDRSLAGASLLALLSGIMIFALLIFLLMTLLNVGGEV